MGALPPLGMLRGASAAFPGRRTADTRPRPGREGGAEGGGRKGGGERGGQRPGWLRSDPGWLGSHPGAEGPSLPGRAAAPQALSPSPPTGVDRTAKHAHPRTWPAGRPRIPKDEVSIWDPQQVPGKQSRRSRPRACAAPSQGQASPPGEGTVGSRMGSTFLTQLMAQKDVGRACGSACGARRVRGSRDQGTSRGRGGRPLQVARRIRA